MTSSSAPSLSSRASKERNLRHHQIYSAAGAAKSSVNNAASTRAELLALLPHRPAEHDRHSPAISARAHDRLACIILHRAIGLARRLYGVPSRMTAPARHHGQLARRRHLDMKLRVANEAYIAHHHSSPLENAMKYQPSPRPRGARP